MNTDIILELAKDAARDKWFACDLELKKQPNNKIRQHRESKAWAELQELEAIITEWNRKE